MVCWLRFLKRVADDLKQFEPELARRKRLAIEVLRSYEREKGHNVEKIGKALDEEGMAGVLRRAAALAGRKRKKRRLTEICEEREEAYAQE